MEASGLRAVAECQDLADKIEQANNGQLPGLGTNKRFERPSLDTCRLLAVKAGMPQAEGDKLFHFYESKGWKVGNQPMKSLNSAVAGWASRWRERQPAQHQAINASEREAERIARGK